MFFKQNNSTAYQLTDHLGNVRAVVSKEGKIDSSTDYYPFGMPMPNRNTVDANGYRYGYQGEFAETDKETGMPAFQLRLYDTRIGRWLTVDPMGQYHSPYMAMDNRPNMSMDPTGGCTVGVDCPEGFNWMGKGTWVADDVVIGGGVNGVNWGSASITGGGLIDFSTGSMASWDQLAAGGSFNFSSASHNIFATGEKNTKSFNLPDGIVTVGGAAASASSDLLFQKGRWWMSTNGKLYDPKIFVSGNQYIGGMKDFAKPISKVAGRLGSAFGAYGIYNTHDQWKSNQIGSARMAQDQLFNGVGFMGAPGAAASFGYNLGYIIEDSCNCNIQVNWRNVSQHKWSKVFQDPNKLTNSTTIFTKEFLGR